MDIENYMGSVEAGDNRGVDLSGITRIIGWTLLGLIIAGIAIFLLMPLFRGVKGGFSPKEGLKRISDGFKKAWQNFVVSFNEFVDELNKRRKTRSWNRIRSRGRGTSDSGSRRATRSAIRRRERKISGRMLRAFFRFTRWGEKRGIAFSFATGPLEYAKKVANELPDLSDDCHDIAYIFEEAVYSNHDTKESRSSDFVSKVRTITKNR
jgi:hypothetical protein